METPSTVSDPFNVAQGPTGTSNGPIFNPAWTPAGSGRTLTFLGASGVSTQINTIAHPDVWFSDINAAAATFARVIYDRPDPLTTYDLSGLLSIIVEGASSTGTSSLVVRLTDADNIFFDIPYSLTTTSADYPFPLADYESNGVDIENIVQIRVQVSGNAITNVEITVEGISFVLICVAKDTRVLMADGTHKLIQNIERGDLVAADTKSETSNKVARLLHTKLPGITNVNMVTIQPYALGKKQPHTKLTITGAHPILYNGSRHRALRFRKFRGVKYHKKDRTKAADVLPANADGTYSLYNIQFEHDGYFVANGLTVDSVPVLCPRLPLPKELFFDQELYNKPSTVEVPPLDKGVLKPIHQ